MDSVLEKLRAFLENNGVKLSRKSLTSLLCLLLLLILLPLGLYLVKQQTNLFPRAEAQWIQIRETGCIKTVNSRKKADCPSIPLKLINPFLSGGSNNSLAPSVSASNNGNSPQPTQTPAASVAPSPSANTGPQNVNVRSFNNNIQQALDSIKQSGGSVYLPEGTYQIGQKIRLYSNTTLFGDGMGRTIIKFVDGGFIDDMMANDSSAGQQNVTVRDLTLQGPDVPRVSDCCGGLKFENLNGGWVINVEVNDVGLDGIYLGYKNKNGVAQGVSNVRITGCKVARNQRQQIGFTAGTNVVIDNCTTDGTNRHGSAIFTGIDLEPDPSTTVTNSYVLNNNVSNSNVGIALNGSKGESRNAGSVSGNKVCNNTVSNAVIGISDSGSNNTVVNNNSSGNDLNGSNTSGSCDMPGNLSNIPAAPSKPSADNSLFKKIIDWFTPQTAKAAGGYISTQTFGCGEILQQPAAGATSGDIIIRAPNHDARGWETFLSNGTVIPEAEILRQLRAENPETTIDWTAEPYTPSCNYKINFNGDCQTTLLGAGKKNNDELLQGQTTTIRVEASNGDVTPGCDQELVFRSRLAGAPGEVSCFYASPNNQISIGITNLNSGLCTLPSGKIGTQAPFIHGETATIGNTVNLPSKADCLAKSALCPNRENIAATPGPPDTHGLAPSSFTLITTANAATPTPTPGGASPTIAPTANPGGTTIMYRLAESQAGLNQAQWKTFAFVGGSNQTANSFEFPPIANAQDSNDIFTDAQNPESDDVFVNGSGSPLPSGSLAKQSIDTTYQLINTTPGAKQIWVQFIHPDGRTVTDSVSFDFIGQAPQIVGLACSLDVSKQNLNINITGARFTNTIGTINVTGGRPEVSSWTDNKITAILKNPNIPLEDGQKFRVKVVRADGSTSPEVICAIGKSLVSLGARLFCREPGKFDAQNVGVTILSENPTNPNQVSKVQETVTIDRDGQIDNLKTQLEVGKNYAIAIKAPGSLRRTTVFTAQEGTTEITNPDGTPFILPIGDIAPVIQVDGQINTLDRAELLRQWRVLGITGSTQSTLTGDFNRDSRVNSIDWACMNYDFGESDDPLPDSVPQPASGVINTGGNSGSGTIKIDNRQQ